MQSAALQYPALWNYQLWLCRSVNNHSSIFIFVRLTRSPPSAGPNGFWFCSILDCSRYTALRLSLSPLCYCTKAFCNRLHMLDTLQQCQNVKMTNLVTIAFLALARESYSVRHFTDLMRHGETLMRHDETPYRSNETLWDSLPIWWDSLPVRTQWAGLPWDSSLMDSHEVSSQLAGVF